MKKAEGPCEICHKYGHKRSKCPTHRDRGPRHRGAVAAMAGYNGPPVLGYRPMHMGMPMGMHMMPMGMQWPVFQGQYPHPHLQLRQKILALVLILEMETC